MALTTTSNRVVATGDNSTTVFAFNRLLYDATHLQVYLDGVLQSSGYTVSGVPGTSITVTFSVAPGTGVQVLLLRVVPLTQLSVYAVGGAFPAATTEKNLDLLMMGNQQFDEILGRAVTLPVNSTLTAANLPDPALAANFGKGIKIKGDGTGLDTYELSATPFTSPLTTKGDIAVYSSAADRLPVGLDHLILTARSSTGAGVAWRDQINTGAVKFEEATDPSKTLALALAAITAATTRTWTIQDKNLTVAGISEFDYSNLAGSPGRMPLPTKFIQGLLQANSSGDVTNDIDITAGRCRDATDAHNIILSSGLTKRLDAAWAVGTNQGGLDTGAIGNNDYYIWAIKRSDTGVCDVLFSLSATAPTMPTNYDFKRLIGWIKRVGGAIVLFTGYETLGGGLEVLWSSPTLDISLANTLTTTRRTDVVKVPVGFRVNAHLNIVLGDATGGLVYIYCPDQADLAPSDTVAPLSTDISPAAGADSAVPITIKTVAGAIAARASLTKDQYDVSTLGFTWARRD